MLPIAHLFGRAITARPKFLGLASLTKITRLARAPVVAMKRTKAISVVRFRIPRIKFRIYREHLGHGFTDAKKQLKIIRRTARALRKFDAQERHAIHELMRAEASDRAEYRRQMREGIKEQVRHMREGERAAWRMHRSYPSGWTFET